MALLGPSTGAGGVSGTGGGGPITIEPAVPTTTTDESTDEDTFQTGSDTLGTRSLGTTTGTGDQDSALVDTGEDDTDIVVEDTSDPDDSSPAGGSGLVGSASRFLDVDEETVSDAVDQTSEQAVGDVVEDVANEQIENSGGGVQPGGDTTPDVEHPDNESPGLGGTFEAIDFGDPRTLVAAGVVLVLAVSAAGGS
ncbi:hypothetical protein [Salarchaeum japonicum]|uniref:PGF-CTERM sorting domain-containing protein n=1 Tax=Salarchaeum japonicum TaxID=555573 RepID=A0AAV3SZM4_9EURY|nr:hypothetical protein [Salarchaeum japonicum]